MKYPPFYGGIFILYIVRDRTLSLQLVAKTRVAVGCSFKQCFVIRNSGFRVPNYLVHPRDSDPHFLRKLGSQVAVKCRKLSSASLDSIYSFFGRHRLQKLSARVFGFANPWRCTKQYSTNLEQSGFVLFLYKGSFWHSNR